MDTQDGSDTEGRPLRHGWTTGACATAAAKAAYYALITGEFPDPVVITLPRGEPAAFALARRSLTPDRALAGVIKDAGDDPDVTHQALILADVTPAPPGAGVRFRAGEGVGTVTRPGLPVAVGEPAINPVPRRMIADAIAEAAAALGASGAVTVTLAIPGGAALAARTWNPRLGIVGGLSILGTTGIVVPYSCSAWIHAIHRGVDVARAAGLDHLGAATGNTSEQTLRRLRPELPEHALIDMGDFAGGLLKYLRGRPVGRLSLAGGFAKLVKLGQGSLDLHSGRSQVDLDWLLARLAEAGAAEAVLAHGRLADSAGQILAQARAAGLPLGDRVAAAARRRALALLDGSGIAVEVVAIDRAGTMVGHSGFGE